MPELCYSKCFLLEYSQYLKHVAVSALYRGIPVFFLDIAVIARLEVSFGAIFNLLSMPPMVGFPFNFIVAINTSHKGTSIVL